MSSKTTDGTIVLSPPSSTGDTTDATQFPDPNSVPTIKRERIVIGGDVARDEVLSLIGRNGYKLPTIDEVVSGELADMGKSLSLLAEKGFPVFPSNRTGFSVSGASPDGSPSGKPVSIGGLDSNGLVRTLDTDSSGHLYTRPFQPVHYSGVCRLTSRPYALSHVFAGAGRFQYATLFHSAGIGKVKTLRVRKVTFTLESVSASVIVTVDFVRLIGTTVPAGANTVAPTPMISDAVGTSLGATFMPGPSESVLIGLPTSQGVEDAGGSSLPYSMLEYNLVPTGAASLTSPPLALTENILWEPRGEEDQLPTVPAGIPGGFAVVVDVNAAVTVNAFVKIEFSEELSYGGFAL